MIIKTKQTWKDLVEGPKHAPHMSRREMIARGITTMAMGVVLPKLLLSEQIANAASIVCPAPTLAPGAIGQIFASGGPTMGARFISEAQAAAMNATMAANYGISGQANLVKLGPNMVIDSTSPFGATLLAGPNGYTGGAAAWKTNVLSKISGGGHLGPFNQDDGNGQDTGLIGGVGAFKASQMGKDLKLGVNNALATWANGLPASSVTSGKNLAPAALAGTFSLTPAAAGLTSSTEMANAASAASTIQQALDPVLNTSTRKAGSTFLTSAGCGFNNNVPLADPTYGSKLFTATGITALTSKLTVSALTTEEQAQLAAYYQSAMGVAGGVIMELGGRDYHGQDPQTVIAPADVEEARAIVMFLAGCDAANAKGAMIYTSNGQAIASGVKSVTASIGGANVTVNAPVAQGDAGGSYNAGLIIFYDPKGAPPAAKFTGTLNTTSGNVKSDANVGSSQQAMSGLYLSALNWVTGAVPPKALAAMQAAGTASIPSNIMLF